MTQANWRQEAACAGSDDPDAWHALPHPGLEPGLRVFAALAVCRSCPVQVDCLDWAMEQGEAEGIWGGLTPQDRHDLALVVTPAHVWADDARHDREAVRREDERDWTASRNGGRNKDWRPGYRHGVSASPVGGSAHPSPRGSGCPSRPGPRPVV